MREAKGWDWGHRFLVPTTTHKIVRVARKDKGARQGGARGARGNGARRARVILYKVFGSPPPRTRGE